MRLMRSIPAPLVVALSLLACVDPRESESGELGAGEFFWLCVDFDNDAACSPDPEGFPMFMPAVAVGSRMDLEYEPEDPPSVPDVITAAAPAMAASTVEGFEILRAGWVPFLVLRDDVAIDVLNLRAEEVDHHEIDWEGGFYTTQVELLVGAQTSFLALPVSAEDVILGGALPYLWTVADESVLEMVSEPDLARIYVEGLSPGTTTLQTSMGSVTIQVVDGNDQQGAQR